MAVPATYLEGKNGKVTWSTHLSSTERWIGKPRLVWCTDFASNKWFHQKIAYRPAQVWKMQLTQAIRICFGFLFGGHGPYSSIALWANHFSNLRSSVLHPAPYTVLVPECDAGHWLLIAVTTDTMRIYDRRQPHVLRTKAVQGHTRCF